MGQIQPVPNERIWKLVKAPKSIPAEAWPPTWGEANRGGFQYDTELDSTTNEDLSFLIRRNPQSGDEDFSIILRMSVPSSGGYLHLQRYNGDSHPHENPIENTQIGRECHIHTATWRYQQRSEYNAEHFAVPAPYTNVDEAFGWFVEICNVSVPDAEERETSGPLL